MLKRGEIDPGLVGVAKKKLLGRKGNYARPRSAGVSTWKRSRGVESHAYTNSLQKGSVPGVRCDCHVGITGNLF